jgi:hypothetical protein
MRDPTGKVENLRVSPTHTAIIAVDDVGALGTMPLKIAQIIY